MIKCKKKPGWQKVLVVAVVQLQEGVVADHQTNHQRDQKNVHTCLQHPVKDLVFVQLTNGFVLNQQLDLCPIDNWICIKFKIGFV